MNKKLAFDNRLCYERSLARHQAIHHHKLQSIVPTALSPSKVYLDSNAPAKQLHLETNPKRKQLDRERQMDIAAQNQRLASKMDHILRRQENAQLAAASGYGVTAKLPRAGSDHRAAAPLVGSTPRTPALPCTPGAEALHDSTGADSAVHKALRTPLSPKKSVHSLARVHMPGIRLDATQTPLVDCYLSPEVAIGRGAACCKHTLINRGVQKQQQERIAEENRRLKQRVQSQKPFYNAKQWDAEWQKSAVKFGHLHQNGTVGYLLPPPKTAPAKHAKLAASPRTLKTRRSVKPTLGLPLIQNSGHDRKLRHEDALTRGTESSERRATDNSTLGCEDDEQSDDGFQVVELPPCLLLEATTRKGVQIHVEELQVELVPGELVSTVSGCVDGDRGLVIRGRWSDAVRGEHTVNAATLERVAQEIDDLEIMIKLETVHRIPHVGNFPRLSELLTETELEKLLVRLVQRLRIEVLEDQKALVISTRSQGDGGRGAVLAPTPPPRSAESGEASEVESEERRHRRRPRTCPSTKPNAHALGLNVASTSHDSGRSTVALRETDRTMPIRLGSWLNSGNTRLGLRHQGVFYLARASYSSHPATFAARAVNLASSACTAAQATYTSVQVETLVRQLDSHELTCDAFVLREIRRLLP